MVSWRLSTFCPSRVWRHSRRSPLRICGATRSQVLLHDRRPHFDGQSVVDYRATSQNWMSSSCDSQVFVLLACWLHRVRRISGAVFIPSDPSRAEPAPTSAAPACVGRFLAPFALSLFFLFIHGVPHHTIGSENIPGIV